ncbi:MAG: GNAT family N-acetyltransferase [Alphaproteobacteria bacterium]|nr:GNAT family N-acetyltransferase [Alphaproteobacteria bacterium]
MEDDAVLETARLRLHLATEAVLAAAGDSPRALSAHLDADFSPDWLSAGLPLLQRAGGWQARGPSRAVVVHRADRLVIGDIRCERQRGPDPNFEIGYAIVPAYRRRGYAVEAAGRIVDWLFTEEGAGLVLAGCHMRNRASVRTLRRLGFWLDGAAGKAFWWRLTPDLRAEARPQA